nr:putative reverse transcriptase domain-containing protein [Tanacetum cinerariifolium]
IDVNALTINNVAKKLHFQEPKFALREFGVQSLILTKSQGCGPLALVGKFTPVKDIIASVAAYALSRNERAKPLRVRALVMTINSNLPPKIHKAQVKSLKKETVKDENLHGMDKEFENRLDETLCVRIRSWLPHIRDLG